LRVGRGSAQKRIVVSCTQYSRPARPWSPGPRRPAQVQTSLAPVQWRAPPGRCRAQVRPGTTRARAVGALPSARNHRSVRWRFSTHSALCQLHSIEHQTPGVEAGAAAAQAHVRAACSGWRVERVDQLIETRRGVGYRIIHAAPSPEPPFGVGATRGTCRSSR
jgi:hypothetical protein